MRIAMLIFCSFLPYLSQAAATGVYAQTVTLTDFADTLEALGTLRANESVDLSANVTERITALHFNDGERVKAGQKLVSFNAAEEIAQRQEQFLVVDEASRQYERVKTLAKDGLAPQSQLDEKRREFLAAQARLDGLDAKMQDLFIVAPFNGKVGIRNVSVGALLTPGDIITTLDDDERMKLDFSVPSTYLPALSEGLRIQATAKALNNLAVEGTIASIDSRVDPITRSIRVRAIIENPDHSLRPGLLMSVRLFKDSRKTLIIAEDALIPEGRQHYVMKITSGSPSTVTKTLVTIGSRIPGSVEILTGLEAGDRVVTHGTVKVRDGSEVKVLAEQALGERLPSLLNKTAGQK
ncbi:efflux RND transporter periplasmic adaptor subunit [Simiduia litorea]|uniref:efflux RND transporter periplasmic adaptor subunit n=1 Tax=Simiduia litorea TaxID=1435348 RepID=UPI0036F19681